MRLLFHENMSGAYHLLARPLEDLAADASLDVSIERVRDFVRAPVLRVDGEVSLDGIATKRPCRGSIALRIANEQRIPYDLHFQGDDGKPYQVFTPYRRAWTPSCWTVGEIKPQAFSCQPPPGFFK